MARDPAQLALFGDEPPRPSPMPDGFESRSDVISAGEERALVERFATLPFRNFEFQGFLGKRRTVSFGFRYDFSERALHDAAAMPEFLMPLREAAAVFGRVASEALVHALVTEYTPGAGIGWHRDRPEFGVVIGVSLLSACVIRFRRRAARGFERASFLAEPRSAYRLDGPVRTEWEHSIAGVDALRYSVTFRTRRA